MTETYEPTRHSDLEPATLPAPGRHARRRLPRFRWAAALLVLVADLANPGMPAAGSTLPASVAVERRLVTEPPRHAERRARERDTAVRAMFDQRAKAILDGDRAAFLADVSPRDAEFAKRQATVFDSLGKLDFAAWSYQQSGESYSTARVDFSRYGYIEDVWLPVLILRYRLEGYDEHDVGRRVVYTVVEHGGRWWIGGDTDLEETTTGGTSVRVEPWENGPIVVKHSKYGIVIGHPEDSRAIGTILAEIERAVRHVTSYVGTTWPRKVVVVLPADADELNRVLENPQVPFEFGAVADVLLTIPRQDEGRTVAGTRVVINPRNFDAKSAFTRSLIRHEITHIALLDRTGPVTPKWLVEGVAEYVGNAGEPLPPDRLAGRLVAEVAKNGVPVTLPTDSDFGVIADAGVGYNAAWLLCRYIAAEYGRAKLLALHDDVGRRTGHDAAGELAKSLRKVLGTTEDALLAGWQSYVRHAVADLGAMLVSPGSAFREAAKGHVTMADFATQQELTETSLATAGVERVAEGYWVDGPEAAPRRRVIETLVVAADEAGAAATERLISARLNALDPGGRAIPHGRIFSVGTTIGGRHYNEAIAVLRTGTVVIEVRVAVPGTGDAGADTRRVAAALYAAVA